MKTNIFENENVINTETVEGNVKVDMKSEQITSKIEEKSSIQNIKEVISEIDLSFHECIKDRPPFPDLVTYSKQIQNMWTKINYHNDLFIFDSIIYNKEINQRNDI